MDDFDLGKILNYFYVFFVVVLIAMIVFFSRLVSIMLTQRKDAQLTKVNAEQSNGSKTYLEDAYTMTVRLTQLAELQSSSNAGLTPGQKEVIVTLAQGRKQALLAVVEENPEAVQSTVFPDDLRSAVPEEARIFIERKGAVQGMVNRIVASESGTQNIVSHFTLTSSDGERYILHFIDEGTTAELTGKTAIVKGVILDNHLIVEAVQQL